MSERNDLNDSIDKKVIMTQNIEEKFVCVLLLSPVIHWVPVFEVERSVRWFIPPWRCLTFAVYATEYRIEFFLAFPHFQLFSSILSSQLSLIDIGLESTMRMRSTRERQQWKVREWESRRMRGKGRKREVKQCTNAVRHSKVNISSPSPILFHFIFIF